MFICVKISMSGAIVKNKGFFELTKASFGKKEIKRLHFYIKSFDFNACFLYNFLSSLSERALSSVGRASVLQTGGRRFESCTAHHISPRMVGTPKALIDM